VVALRVCAALVLHLFDGEMVAHLRCSIPPSFGDLAACVDDTVASCSCGCSGTAACSCGFWCNATVPRLASRPIGLNAGRNDRSDAFNEFVNEPLRELLEIGINDMERERAMVNCAQELLLQLEEGDEEPGADSHSGASGVAMTSKASLANASLSSPSHVVAT
jgi:hypothetical protein